MSTDHTTNYDLNQWEGTDKVLRTEFNADNAKIDAALKANADAIAAEAAAREALAETVALKGNCRILMTSYQGTGAYGETAPTSLVFPQGEPELILIMDEDCRLLWIRKGCTRAVNGNGSVWVTWSAGGASWYSSQNGASQMNSYGTYYVFYFYVLE